MSNSLDPEIKKRVLYTKLLLRRAIRIQEETADSSFAISVLLLHDSAEMLMVAVTDKLHLRAPNQFSDFWKNLVEKGYAEPPYRNAMERLNKARVAFKHHGIVPNATVARDLVSNVQAFCEDVTLKYLDLGFAQLSLADLVANQVARDHLKASEAEFSSDKKGEAFASLKKSFDTILRELAVDIPFVTSSRFDSRAPRLPDNLGIRELDTKIRELNNYLEAQNKLVSELTLTVNMMTLGADLQRYKYFVKNTPIVQRSFGGRETVLYTRSFEHVDEAVFTTCYEFVVDFALQTSTLFRPAAIARSAPQP